MEPTPETITLEQLAIRLNELERENARLRDALGALQARLETDRTTVVAVHRPAAEEPTARTSRRGVLRTVAGLLAATAGAGALLSPRAAAALASGAEGQTAFTSTTTGPTVWVTNDGVGPGLHSHGDTGVAGFSTSATGTGSGVYGYSNSTAGSGVYGAGHRTAGIGVSGHGATGVSGTSVATAGSGVRGLTNNGTGVDGGGVTGVSGIGAVAGVSGTSDSGTGVSGQTKDGHGVSGASSLGIGVSGTSSQGLGVFGHGGTFGVQGQGTTGVQGTGADRGGVFQGGPTGAAVQLVASSAPTHPASGQTGDLFVDAGGNLWYCRGGTTWAHLA